eukprot:GHVR01110835.1.p1 GENE.GHVR01110835.1~~GHVR01110835.1.p1  ORF type:complete len:112 (-),score=15.35 GHVR01110835.1:273-608(-)
MQYILIILIQFEVKLSLFPHPCRMLSEERRSQLKICDDMTPVWASKRALRMRYENNELKSLVIGKGYSKPKITPYTPWRIFATYGGNDRFIYYIYIYYIYIYILYIIKNNV